MPIGVRYGYGAALVASERVATAVSGIEEHVTFDEVEIRAAERNLEAALEAPDREAWVF